ncbi:MAG: hypothetical protein ACRDTM_05140 [Micromonosporaceae bacterium]
MESVRDWLMAGDPSIRWQAMAQLGGAAAGEVAAERARVASEGWGARLLEQQAPDGTWAGGLYSPKWTSTTYTLLLLWGLGLQPGHPAAVAGVHRLYDGVGHYMGGHRRARSPEACITGMFVGLAAYFGVDRPETGDAVSWLLERALLPDGGWNCEAPRTGSRHSSFHTTILVLEGLTELCRRRPDPVIEERLAGGRRFLLAHRMFRSHRTGEVVDARYTRFSYPPRWHYDVLRGLDHLRDVAAPPDPAAAEAVELVRERRGSDGRWRLQNRWHGKTWFELEPPRQPSRWNTLRALRVLRWWERPAES